MQGIAKARDVGFLDASGGSWRFDLAEYEHYEQVGPGCAADAPVPAGKSRSLAVGWAVMPSCRQASACKPQHTVLHSQVQHAVTGPAFLQLLLTYRVRGGPSHVKVENGDLNWILPGKLLAFSGPAARPTDYVGFRAMVPEDYWDYFRRRGIQGVVRLNKKVCACVLTHWLRHILIHVRV